jgi:hypothetical protein
MVCEGQVNNRNGHRAPVSLSKLAQRPVELSAIGTFDVHEFSNSDKSACVPDQITIAQHIAPPLNLLRWWGDGCCRPLRAGSKKLSVH